MKTKEMMIAKTMIATMMAKTMIATALLAVTAHANATLICTKDNYMLWFCWETTETDAYEWSYTPPTLGSFWLPHVGQPPNEAAFECTYMEIPYVGGVPSVDVAHGKVKVRMPFVGDGGTLKEDDVTCTSMPLDMMLAYVVEYSYYELSPAEWDILYNNYWQWEWSYTWGSYCANGTWGFCDTDNWG